MKYALINPNDQIDRFGSDEINQFDRIDPNTGTRKGWRWLPYEIVTPKAYDPERHSLYGTPVIKVMKTKVTETWSEVRNLN